MGVLQGVVTDIIEHIIENYLFPILGIAGARGMNFESKEVIEMISNILPMLLGWTDQEP